MWLFAGIPVAIRTGLNYSLNFIKLGRHLYPYSLLQAGLSLLQFSFCYFIAL